MRKYSVGFVFDLETRFKKIQKYNNLEKKEIKGLREVRKKTFVYLLKNGRNKRITRSRRGRRV